ncbi:MAG: 4Fe-4S binding protein [Deltaproteobacteria bacterium]|nr:4Fe-4S binding protein [Deltaproteobacteria bacterium]
MGHFIDSIRAMGTTLRNFLRPPVTVEYPTVIRPRPERHRVSFALLIDETGDEACIGCLACERICPSQVIAIKQAPKRESKVTGKKRGYADDFTLDLEACIFCELCVQVCPTDAIVMCREPEVPGFCREDLVLTMDKLYANQKDKALSWGTAGKLLEMQDPARGKAEAKSAEGGEDKSAEAGAEKPKAKAGKAKAAKPAPEPAKSAPEPAKSAPELVVSSPVQSTEPAPATDAKPPAPVEVAAKAVAPAPVLPQAAEPAAPVTEPTAPAQADETTTKEIP